MTLLRRTVAIGAVVALSFTSACSTDDTVDEGPSVSSLEDQLACVQQDGERSVEDLFRAGGELAEEDEPSAPAFVGTAVSDALRSLEAGHQLFESRPGLLAGDALLREGRRVSEALYVEEGEPVVFVDLRQSPDGQEWYVASIVVCARPDVVT